MTHVWPLYNPPFESVDHGSPLTRLYSIYSTLYTLDFILSILYSILYVPLYHTNAIPYHTIPYHTIPCHTMPCHAMPCHAMPYNTIPYHITFWLWLNAVTEPGPSIRGPGRRRFRQDANFLGRRLRRWLEASHMGVSKTQGPQNKPRCTMILTIGTPIMGHQCF